MSTRKISVIGGGSFGTVIANITAENGYDVSFWMRSASKAEQLNRTRENSQYLPNYLLNERIVATNDMAAAVKDSGLIFVAVPSSSFRQVVRDMVPHIAQDAVLVSTTKGIESGSFDLMTQILNQEAPNAKVGVLSGPNLAVEIAKKDLTGTVIASPDEQVRELVKSVLKSKYFRVYANNDMFGVELGGSLKNIYAIIAGIAAALVWAITPIAC